MPDYEMRLAILRKKTQMEGILIDDDILSLIATKIDSNIRGRIKQNTSLYIINS